MTTEPHTIADLYRDFGGYWVAMCSCHNPDGEGVGSAEFYGETPLEAVNGWEAHHDEQQRDGQVRWPLPEQAS